MRLRLVILISVALALILATFFVPRIPQDPAYHNFADQRGFFGIPHFCDVVSNVPFFFVGLWGLVITARRIRDAERWAYFELVPVVWTGFAFTLSGGSVFWVKLPWVAAGGGSIPDRG